MTRFEKEYFRFTKQVIEQAGKVVKAGKKEQMLRIIFAIHGIRSAEAVEGDDKPFEVQRRGLTNLCKKHTIVCNRNISDGRIYEK
ncbi:MAG: hypothetical protein HZC18_08255 [Candidatus Omnitrophica bacterium]|nr:hypothetical protein [Candidatus Omnitrophota bacterium]